MSLPWIPLSPRLPSHRKAIHLASLVGDADAWRFLYKLWSWVAIEQHEGRLKDGCIPFPGAEAVLEFVCGWSGERGKLAQSMRTAGWLDVTAQGLVPHDWKEHTGKHLQKLRAEADRASLNRKRQTPRKMAEMPDDSHSESIAYAYGTALRSKNKETKREGAAARQAPSVPKPALPAMVESVAGSAFAPPAGLSKQKSSPPSRRTAAHPEEAPPPGPMALSRPGHVGNRKHTGSPSVGLGQSADTPAIPVPRAAASPGDSPPPSLQQKAAAKTRLARWKRRWGAEVVDFVLKRRVLRVASRNGATQELAALLQRQLSQQLAKAFTRKLAPKGARPPDPLHTPLVKALSEAYEAARGHRYTFDRRRDPRAITELLGHSRGRPAEVLRRWGNMLACQGYHRLDSIADFATPRRWNFYGSEPPAAPVTHLRPVPSPVAQWKASCEVPGCGVTGGQGITCKECEVPLCYPHHAEAEESGVLDEAAEIGRREGWGVAEACVRAWAHSQGVPVTAAGGV